MVDYYVESPDRADRVRALFANIARRYDWINDVQSFGLHRLWKRRLIRSTHIQPGERALDVCCGTGDLALRLSERGASVVGVDFCEPMLEIARKRSREVDDAARLNFELGDATRLEFADESFDVVTIAYGLRNLDDLDAGLREITRVLRPSGRVAILDFGLPENPILRRLFSVYLRAVVPLFGLVFSGDAAAYAYILESLKRFPKRQEIANRLRELGLESVDSRPILFGSMAMVTGRKGA